MRAASKEKDDFDFTIAANFKYHLIKKIEERRHNPELHSELSRFAYHEVIPYMIECSFRVIFLLSY